MILALSCAVKNDRLLLDIFSLKISMCKHWELTYRDSQNIGFLFDICFSEFALLLGYVYLLELAVVYVIIVQK